MSKAEIAVARMDEVLSAVEESTDAANLLVLEAALGRFEAEGVAAADGQLCQTAECAAQATADMAHLMGSAGLF